MSVAIGTPGGAGIDRSRRTLDDEMRIAQLAPLHEAVPPRRYGGTERVVSWLTEELVRRGHEVTLFASGDSRTQARLVPCAEQALRLDPRVRDPLAHHVLMLEQLRTRAGEFDVVHFHIDYLHFPLMRALGLPHVTTLHGRLDLWDLEALYAAYGDMPLVSISDAQRRPLAGARWMATVHHGLPAGQYPFSPRGGHRLVFLGRICPEKRPDRAIEIATRAGRELVIAAKVDAADRDYFEACIRPLLSRPNVQFVGEVTDREKVALLGEAHALVMPVDWPEPFGLVMIEAMACGTPVLAWRAGSTPEVVDDGVSGRLVDGIDAAVRAVEEIGSLDRRAVRACFEARFTVERMADAYVDVYTRLQDVHGPVRTAA